MTKIRCAWAKGPLNETYHDKEWGVPCFCDQRLFEFLILEGMQAGLSWEIILKKRENYRAALDDFAMEKIARYATKKQSTLLKNPGLIRNKLKIASIITNAQSALRLKESHGSLKNYFWQWVDGNTLINNWKSAKNIPAHTPLSEKLSKDLRQKGFKFVGPTICYAFMQAIGMVNDHTTDCFRHKALIISQ